MSQIKIEDKNSLLLHASCIAKGKAAYLFLGPSNSGKTTIAKFSKGRRVIAEEATSVKRTGPNFYAHKIPLFWTDPYFEAEGKIPFDGKVKIEKAFILKKSKRVSFERLSKAESFAITLNQAMLYLRVAKGGPADAFKLCREFIERVPCYEMRFKRGPSFWKGIEELER